MNGGISYQEGNCPQSSQEVIGWNHPKVWPSHSCIIGSDNGPAFISQVIQGLGKILGTSWKLHCAYHPQSSGQVERMNRTLKEILTKLTWETGGDCVALLPFAILRARNTPYLQGLTPCEIMLGRPPPLSPRLKADLLAEVTKQEVL